MQFTIPEDSKTTIPADNAQAVHEYQMQNNPGYAENFAFQQETSNQALQDMSGMFIPAGRGLGLGSPTKANTAKQAQTAELFAIKDAIRNENIMKGVEAAELKGLGRLKALEEFKLQDAYRNQAIQQGLQQNALKQEAKSLGL